MAIAENGTGGSLRNQDDQASDHDTINPPRLISQTSNSLPSTPRQHPRDYHLRTRTPSAEIALNGHASPRSVSAEQSRLLSMRPTNPACRFQSTQTSKRRIAYTIGDSPLLPPIEEPKRVLYLDEEQRLEAEVDRLYKELQPTEESQKNRLKVVEKLRRILKDEWPDKNFQVTVFGSSGNLLCTSKSDVDICITVTGVENVCVFAELLDRQGMKKVTCVHAKAVPIVKIFDPELHMACDLNVNNNIAIKNTRMVKAYMQMDDRVRALAMLVKHWTQQRVINEASGGTLSSYTWTLLVIHFFQTLTPPILPILSLKQKNGETRDVFTDDTGSFDHFGAGNKSSLAQLVFQFYRHYGFEVDYETEVISVREGKFLNKTEKNWHRATNNRLCIEEPFNTDRNLGNTADDTACRGLHLELQRAFNFIAEGNDFSSDVCEPYVFQAHETKSIFERPPAQPRPIISRSTSQSGRGRGSGGGGRGNRNKYDLRGGANQRRSSSAAAFGHNSQNIVHAPQLVFPGPEYMVAAQRADWTSELSRLSQQLTADEQELRHRQMMLSQTQLQQAQAYVSSQNRGSISIMPPPLRPVPNGISNPRNVNMEQGPGSAPLYHGYTYNPQYEVAPAMSQSSSYQGTTTNPSSPSLSATTPYRRQTQRQNVLNSAGATIRSHSQPARPPIPQQANNSGSRLPYNSMAMPYPYLVRPEQLMANGMPRHSYYGPYVGQHGAYYMTSTTSDAMPTPREYLGYGIDESPRSRASPRDAALSRVPSYEDVGDHERSSSPKKTAGPVVMSSPRLGNSSLPVPFPAEYHGAARPTTRISGLSHLNRHSMHFGQIPPATAPLIVNGSNQALSTSEYAEMPSQGQLRSPSDSMTSHARSPDLLASNMTSADPVVHESPYGSSFGEVDHDLVRTTTEQTDASENGYPRNDQASFFPLRTQPIWDLPPPASHLAVSDLAESTRLAEQAGNRSGSIAGPSAPEQSPNGNSPKSIGTHGGHISTSNISATPERTREIPSNIGAALSPVQELRTPSPSASRKVENVRAQNRSIDFKGGDRASSSRDALAGSLLPNEHLKENDSSLLENQAESLRHATVLPLRPSPALPQTNPWQQAGKKTLKKGKGSGHGRADSIEFRSRGETLPPNEADRKGG